MFDAHFIVSRESADEHTYATVRAKVIDKDLLCEGVFCDRLRIAVTNWVNLTEDGQTEWRHSSQDFNVGDLSNVLGDKKLKQLLRNQGIHNLRIDITTANDPCLHWTYDTVLVNEIDLKER